MNVLVDTCVWSMALRRKKPDKNENAVQKELAELIEEYRVKMIGPIRQELLTGIKEKKDFESLKSHLRAFADIPITLADYELAAVFSNRCMAKGIQGSATDYLICATAVNNKLKVFTVDKDFERYAAHTGLQLYPFMV